MSEDIERRILCEESEVRAAAGDDGKRRIEGYAVMFNSLSRDLGGFRERFLPTAFDSVLRTSPDVVALFNHDYNYILGRTKAGTLRLFADGKGLGYTIDPPSSRADVLEAIDRGDVRGSSFAFTVTRKGGDKWSEEDGVIVREVRNVAKLLDVSPVVNPAYPDTTVARRSLGNAGAIQIEIAPGMSLDDVSRRIRFLELSAEHRS